MAYSSGNYESICTPLKSLRGVDNKSAYLIGSGGPDCRLLPGP